MEHWYFQKASGNVNISPNYFEFPLSEQAFWQGARVRDRTIRSNPHNHAQSEKSRTILKNLLKMLIKSGIPINFQDF